MSGRVEFSLRRDFVKTIIRLAEKEVPFPWLYFAEILPVETYDHPIHPINYCFRINNRFAVTLRLQDEQLTPGQMSKWEYQFHYEPISNFRNLMSLGQALESIETMIKRRELCEIEAVVREYFKEIINWEGEVEQVFELENELRFVEFLFDRFPLGPFHSCALYKLFSAEWREPFYFFRLHNSCDEILVGAVSGEVRFRRNEEKNVIESIHR